MNKTIIININGIVFHIEEDAYEVIRTYMTDVKRHFAYSPDSDEIVNDIENRLAEMFSERLTQEHKQVIILQDVEEVIAQMGKVSDFEDADETQTPLEDGGSIKVEKRLFRDMDDRIVGGVCSGIGHYFDIEPRWIRFIFFLTLFLGGSGFIAYIILWIVMPKAQTRADKMAMKGEAINLQNFKKNFDEELESLKENFSHAATEAKPLLQKIGAFVRDLISHFGAFLRGAGKIIVKALSVFIVFGGGMLLLGIVVAFITFLGLWETTELNSFPFTIINPEYRSILYVSAFVIVFIPLLALVLFAIRVLFNKKLVSKNTSFGMLIVWVIGVSFAIFYGSRIASEFNERATLSQTLDIKPSPVYHLELDATKFLTHEDSVRYNIDSLNLGGRMVIEGHEDEFDAPNNFSLTVEKSDIEKPILIQTFTSHGPNFEAALQSVKNIRYQFSQADSVLRFDWRAHLAKKDLWRDQEVNLTLKVPANTRLFIDGRLNRYFENVNLWNCLPDGLPNETPTEWMMSPEGLKCVNDSLYKRKSEWH